MSKAIQYSETIQALGIKNHVQSPGRVVQNMSIKPSPTLKVPGIGLPMWRSTHVSAIAIAIVKSIRFRTVCLKPFEAYYEQYRYLNVCMILGNL